MGEKETMHRTQSVPVKDDYIRNANNLDAYNAKVGAPHYTQDRRMFQALDDDGNIIGELIAEIVLWTIEIKMLHVDENNRGKGIGKKLVQAAETYGKNNKALTATVWTATWQGEGFYERCGFKEVTRCPLNCSEYFEGKPQFNIFYRKDIA